MRNESLSFFLHFFVILDVNIVDQSGTDQEKFLSFLPTDVRIFVYLSCFYNHSFKESDIMILQQMLIIRFGGRIARNPKPSKFSV